MTVVYRSNLVELHHGDAATMISTQRATEMTMTGATSAHHGVCGSGDRPVSQNTQTPHAATAPIAIILMARPRRS